MITNNEQVQHNCPHCRTKKAGTTKAGTQRYKCLDCGKRFTESTALLGGMRIGMDKAVQIVSMLCEGVSVRATARLCSVDVYTVLDLLTLVGPRCKEFLESKIRNVQVADVQCDEIWQFVYCKRRTSEVLEPDAGYGGPCGDSWCWTAVERHTKLVLAWHFGRRYNQDADEFCRKVRVATAPSRFQLSTDGYQPYLSAVATNLADRVDYGMLVKIYKGNGDGARAYSPAKIVSARRVPVSGNPDTDLICTSHTERNNGTIRCFMKRMGRLTYCFSKKWGNHECAMALHFAHYNFCRPHKSLKNESGKRTPAMASGLAKHVWSVRELLETVAAA